MQPQPRLAIDEIARERSAIWYEIAQSHAVNELKVRRLLNRLDRLGVTTEKVNPATAAALHEQAYLHSYLGHGDFALDLFTLSEIAGLPKFAGSISRSHALYICGEIEMSKNAVLATDISSVDASGLSSLADGCVLVGLFQHASELYLRSGRAHGELSSKAVVAAEIMEEVGASDEQVSERISVAGKIIKKFSSHPFIAFDLFAMHGEGILYRFTVKGEIEDLAILDSAIDDALSSFNDPLDSIFSIGICPFEEGAQVLAADGYHVGL